MPCANRPTAVLLLDEIEKAHADIFNTLLQVMDYATLTDNSGRKADFRNVVLIMTSNAGAKELGRTMVGFQDATAFRDASPRPWKSFSPPNSATASTPSSPSATWTKPWSRASSTK